MKIFVVRHGETDSNKNHKLMGQTIDEPLNTEGIKQVNDLTKNIQMSDFDIIFTSTLKRARQTAEIIANKIKVPIIESREILERDFGSMTGKSWEEMDNIVENINFKKTDRAQKYDYRPYGGESVEDVKIRTLNFIENLKNKYSNKKVLIVAHGGIVKIIGFLVSGIPINTPDNGSIHQFNI
jgi:broad specificity phosphatase PhoE